LKRFLFAKLNCCSTPTFTVFIRQPEGFFPRSPELIMNHYKPECKDAIGSGVHARFPQVFVPALYFSVATGLACFVALFNSYRIGTGIYNLTVTWPFVSAEGMPSKDKYTQRGTLKMSSYVAFRISRRNAIQRYVYTERHAQNVLVSQNIRPVASIGKDISTP
jgi:hypothetical protein